jgi:type II secretory pathway component GspD/PulD (secretin)
MNPILALALVFTLGGSVCGSDTASNFEAKDTVGKKESEAKVSISAKDSKLMEVLDSLAKQSNQRIVVESTVKGTLGSLSLSDVTLESALTAVCKAGKVEWCKIYLNKDSKLLEQPDKLAATVRLLGGLSFPDVIQTASSIGKTAVHLTNIKSVEDSIDDLVARLGLTPAYVITNDIAAAAKRIEKKGDGGSRDAAVERYAQIAKDQIDLFMKMSPEEREQAIFESINIADQVDPSYVSIVMQTLMNTDQEKLRRLVARQTEILFHMSDEQRRAMLKLNMQTMSMLTPEQQKILQEDAIAVMKEMQAEQGK